MDTNYYKQYEPIDGKWYITKELGASPYGFVFEVERKDMENVRSAMKIISIPSSKEEVNKFRKENPELTDEDVEKHYYGIVEDYVEELSYMSGVKSCPNIVSYEEYEAKKRTDYIGWDILIRKEIFQSMDEYFKDNITQENVIRFGIDICNALEICRKHNMIHGDLKPSNIFVDEKGTFKLGDFGASQVLKKAFPDKKLPENTDNIYTAPEIIGGRRYTAVADVYSLGIIMYQLLNDGLEPFRDSYNEQDAAKAVEKRVSGQKISAPRNADTRMSEIILKACEYYPHDRYESPGELKQRLEDLIEGKFEPVSSEEDVYYEEEDKAETRYYKKGYSEEKKRVILTGIIAVFVIVCVICAGFNFHYKSIYQKAERKLSIMRFDEARELFKEIYWYRDAQHMILKCDYEEAIVLLENGSYTEAEGIFNALEQKNYPNAHLKRCECMLARAQEYLKIGDPESAMEILDAINSPGTKTMDRLVEEAKCQAADLMFFSGKYVSARKIYQKLGKTTKVNECSYAIAQKHKNEKNYIKAMAWFKKLGSYGDSEMQFAQTEEILIDENGKQDLFASFTNMEGRYVSQDGSFVEYKSDKEGIPQLECNVPMEKDDFFKLENGIHYHGSDSKGWTKQWIFEFVSMDKIIMYNYNDDKIYEFTIE